MELIPHGLTPGLRVDGIRSLVGFGNLVGPLAHPVLYRRHGPPEASPKAISGRTSYHQVCLAFHPYPQLIPQVFNLGGCGPPQVVTPALPWPWVAHLASGLLPATNTPYSDSLSLRLHLTA